MARAASRFRDDYCPWRRPGAARVYLDITKVVVAVEPAQECRPQGATHTIWSTDCGYIYSQWEMVPATAWHFAKEDLPCHCHCQRRFALPLQPAARFTTPLLL
jgi:hypothetical protein